MSRLITGLANWAHFGRDRDSREIGYGIEAMCDDPGCEAAIDRGLSYVCGGMHGGGDHGCGRYFCGEHLTIHPVEDVQVCWECSGPPLEGRGPESVANESLVAERLREAQADPAFRRAWIGEDLICRLGIGVIRTRHPAGMTVDDLARKPKIPRERILNIEAANMNVSLRTVGRLAFALDVDPATLLAAGASPPGGAAEREEERA